MTGEVRSISGIEKDESDDRRRFRLDTRVSIADLIAFFGILLTVVGIGGPVLVWGGAITERQSQQDKTIERLFIQLEKTKTDQHMMDARQDLSREALRQEILTELREIRRAVETKHDHTGKPIR